MEWIYLLLIGILSFALVYIMVQARVSSTIEKKLNDYYKSQIQGDMQEFYREMESHAAILDSRVGRFKKLVERQEENLKAWDKIYQALKSTKKGGEASRLVEQLEELKNELQKELRDSELNIQRRIDQISQMRGAPSPAGALFSSGKNAPRPPSPPPPENAPPSRKTPARPPESKRPVTKTAPDELDDLYDDLIESMDTAYTQKGSSRPPATTPRTAPADELAAAAPSGGSGNVLTGILGGIGKILMPLLESAPAAPRATPEKPPAERFDSLLTRNLATSAGRPAVNTPSPQTPASIPQKRTVTRENSLQASTPVTAPPQAAPLPPADHDFTARKQERHKPQEETSQGPLPPHSLEKKVDPESLIDLLERLRGPAGRPEALRNLIKSGFNVSQISELSGIPLSDLEMTRSIYSIPDRPQAGE